MSTNYYRHFQNSMDQDCIENLRNQFFKNKKRFETNLHNMNQDQIVLEDLLLSIEENMFSKTKEPETLEEALENTKTIFLKDLECCGEYFKNFNHFIKHMETTHHNEDVVSEDEEIAKQQFHESFKEKKEIESIANFNYSDIIKSDNNSPLLKQNKDKPFKCNIPSCKKSYTSAYGLRYHIENGHILKDDSDKPYACQFKDCGKRYKNTNGLKYHIEHNHYE